MGQRLKQARSEAGFKTATEAIARFGWKGSTYRAHENGQNNFGAQEATVYGKAYGVSAGWLLTGEAFSAAPASMQPYDALSGAVAHIAVKGSVAAGVWKEPEADAEAGLAERARPAPIDPRYPVDMQFDYLVEGTSLNRIAREGEFIRCVDAALARGDLKDGDLVVIERTRAPNLKEISARRLRRFGGRHEFWNESDDPRWQAPVAFSDEIGESAEQVRVLAKILWTHRPVGSFS